jgi:ribosomal protein S18 acetylase RimI-like enzyme
MRYLMTKLREAGAPGMHLHVSPKNHGAQAFYRTLGFRVVQHASLPQHTVFMAAML